MPGKGTIYSLIDFRSLNGAIIDVRSPKEFEQGHWPEAINIPIFTNEERAHIGKIYKREGREKAILIGLEAIIPKIDGIKYQLLSVIDKENNNQKTPLRIYCWRGGMRSASINWFANSIGIKSVVLSNGYKNYRKWVLDQFTKSWEIKLLGGKTGCGKTEILSKINNNQVYIIDLEGLANHKGSSFGGLGMQAQPTNQQYENEIAESLDQAEEGKYKEIWVEAESSNIGKCRVPKDFYSQMKSAPRINIIRTKEERVIQLVKEYSKHSKEGLIESILRIKKRLGPQRTSDAIKAIEREEWAKACIIILEYYDKCYEYESNNSQDIKNINLSNLTLGESIKRLLEESKK